MSGKKDKKIKMSSTGDRRMETSKSLASLDSAPSAGVIIPKNPVETLHTAHKNGVKADGLLPKAYALYSKGEYEEAIKMCDTIYDIDAFRTDNLLLLSSLQFQLRNFSESVFFAQQCIRVDPNFAEAYSNLGNALKELGDIRAAVQFYNKAIKLKPRFADAYNNLATAHMQLGQLDEAKETYRMALVLDPKLVDAHNNLGNLHKAVGDLETAKHCYLEAIRIKPEFAIAWNNLAGVFKDEGELPTAVAYFKESIRIVPEFADAHSNLGNALKEMKQHAEAIKCYETALKLRPDFAIAHGNIGTCHYEMGNIKAAITAFKYAIQLEPNFPDAHNNLGSALHALGRLDDAILSFRAALRLKPDHPHAYNNLGNAMKSKGFIKEAMHCFVTAIRLMPRLAHAHNNMGMLLKEQGKLEQGIAHFHEAVSIDPALSDTYCNMGNAYKSLGRMEEAIKCYDCALGLKPDFPQVYANLGSAYKESGLIAEAIEAYRRALQLKPVFPDAFASLTHTLAMICDWRSRREDFFRISYQTQMQLSAAQAALSRARGVQPGPSGYHSSTVSQFSPRDPGTAGSASLEASVEESNEEAAGGDASDSVTGRGGIDLWPSVQPLHSLMYPFSLLELLQIAQRYAAKAGMSVSLVEHRKCFKPRGKVNKITVGYVSSDFGNHPIAHQLLSLFKMHNRDRFHVIGYGTTEGDSSYWRKSIEMSCDEFRDISHLSAEECCKIIRNDQVLILIDLNGYTKNARTEIFALKPSPVQLHFMGFSGTMGADFYDYIIADPIVIPEAFRMYYREKVLYMPHSYVINDHKQAYPGVFSKQKQLTRANYGLDEDKFVFCNFNQLYKIGPEVFDVWMRILKRVPNAVLWLLRWPGLAEVNLLQEAKKRGVRDDQIIFSDVVPKQEHISRGYLADLALDTPVVNGHTSTCDILWSGTPMLTLPGDRMASRVGASILSATGMNELICSSFIEYEELAVTLALDVNKLYQLRRRLEGARKSCAAFDTQRYVRNLESGFQAIWERYECGLPADYVFVEDTEPVAIDEGDNVFGESDEPMLSIMDENVKLNDGKDVDKNEMSHSYDDVFEEDS